MKETVGGALLFATAAVSAASAGANTLSTGWIRDAELTQPDCISVGLAVGQDLGFEVAGDSVSVAMKHADGTLITVQCDAAPYVFFVVNHPTMPSEDVAALADTIEAHLSQRIALLR